MPDFPPAETPVDHGPAPGKPLSGANVLTDIFPTATCEPSNGRLVTEGAGEPLPVSATLQSARRLIELRVGWASSIFSPRIVGRLVRKVTARSVREVCQVRKVLECGGGSRGGEAGLTASKVKALAAMRFGTLAASRLLIRLPSPVPANSMGNTFHDLIRESCGNAFLADELARLRTLPLSTSPRRDVGSGTGPPRFPPRCSRWRAEHLAITDALTSQRLRKRPFGR